MKACLRDGVRSPMRTRAKIPFEQGCVWHMDCDWVQPVIRECAQFPNGAYDDWWIP
jgi:hypothetical protein